MSVFSFGRGSRYLAGFSLRQVFYLSSLSTREISTILSGSRLSVLWLVGPVEFGGIPVNRRLEMLLELLQGIEMLEEFREPPESIARQFVAWVSQAAIALEIAHMNDELELWKAATERVHFADDESAMFAQMKSMKAILLGILDQLEGGQPVDPIFDIEVIAECTSYVRRIATQVIGCYERAWHDACMVMVRRLLETLIIECYEKHGIGARIRNTNGDYFFLGPMIDLFMSQACWHVSRNARSSLSRLKDIKKTADMAAHNRRFLANRQDVDCIRKDLRICIQELVYIAGADSGKQTV